MGPIPSWAVRQRLGAGDWYSPESRYSNRGISHPLDDQALVLNRYSIDEKTSASLS